MNDSYGAALYQHFSVGAFLLFAVKEILAFSMHQCFTERHGSGHL